MQNRFVWYRSSILIIMVIVILSVFGSALIAERVMSRRLTNYFQIRNAADLALASTLGQQICEHYFAELLNLRLSDDKNMLSTLRNESLSEIRDLSDRFAHIGIAVVENGSELVLTTASAELIDDGIFNLPKKFPEDLQVYTLSDGTMIYWTYFPFWKWHIISMLTAVEARLPVQFVQYTLFHILIVILTVFVVTLLLVFRYRIYRPLRILANAAEDVRNGRMVKTGIIGIDEIGIVSAAFDEMVDSLSASIDQLRKTSDFKDVLLMEVHHRVRNNLNIITSLLNLRANTLNDTDDLVRVFEDSQNRIMTMALIHGQLYDTGDFDSLYMERFLHDLVINIRGIYDRQNRIKMNFEVEDLKVDIDKAVTLGLLLNEIITNAFKHAFDSRDSGVINISFRKDNGYYVLEVRDDGKGLPEGLKEQNGNTLGFHLIRELSYQLRGAAVFLSGAGLTIRIVFPENENKQ